MAGGHVGATLNDRFGGVLSVGQCEPLKAAVHAIALGIAGLCAAYNAAAWLHRREQHLAVNTVLYGAAVLWECCHVKSHLDECSAPAPALERSADRTVPALVDAA
jgi:hypothetical protein